MTTSQPTEATAATSSDPPHLGSDPTGARSNLAGDPLDETLRTDGWPPASPAEASEVERFLYDEAALLDSWDLERWIDLVTPDITYVVPVTDVREGDPDLTLTFINDDIGRLRARVVRLTSRRAFREYPFSRTRRLLANVRVDGEPGGPHYAVSANFTVHWFRNRHTAVYVGRYEQLLRRTEEGLRIARRVAILDMEALDPHGAVSVIL